MCHTLPTKKKTTVSSISLSGPHGDHTGVRRYPRQSSVGKREQALSSADSNLCCLPLAAVLAFFLFSSIDDILQRVRALTHAEVSSAIWDAKAYTIQLSLFSSKVRNVVCKTFVVPGSLQRLPGYSPKCYLCCTPPPPNLYNFTIPLTSYYFYLHLPTFAAPDGQTQTFQIFCSSSVPPHLPDVHPSIFTLYLPLQDSIAALPLAKVTQFPFTWLSQGQKCTWPGLGQKRTCLCRKQWP